MNIDFSGIHTSTRVGIMLSGGMDSALLLYLLAKNLDSAIYPFTIPKTDGAARYVNSIVDWINIKLNKTIYQPQLVGNPNLHHTQIVNSAMKEIDSKYDILFFAGNTYPETILPNGPVRVKRTNPKHVQPFFDLYKTDILQGYIDNHIMDLLLLTHTCTEQQIGRCTTCWQCKERQWAFEQLCIIDPSNN